MMDNRFSKGLNRGNKLYEGHRMMLPEHKEAITNRKRAEYQLDEPLVSQSEEMKNEIISAAIQQRATVEIYWQETVNPLKLHPEEYARYLHNSLKPNAIRSGHTRCSIGVIAGYVAYPPALKCKLDGANKLIAVSDVISVKLFHS